MLVCACAGHQTGRTARDFSLVSTAPIIAPDCKPARGITTIMMVQDLLPEHLSNTAAVRDIRIVIDWKTTPHEDSLLLRMVGFTYLKGRKSNQTMPVKLYDADCKISPAGQVLSVKIKPKKTDGQQQELDQKKIKRMEKVAAGFTGMFIPAFQVKTLTAGEVVASSVEYFDRIVDENTVVKTEYIYRGLSRRKDRMLIVVDYNQQTEVGPYTIIQEGYHLYHADWRYLVESRGSTYILQDGKPYYRVNLLAITKFSK